MIETRATTAYDNPLLIKHLLHTPLNRCADQEIISGLQGRYSYKDFTARLGRFANAFGELGLKPGHTVAVMDWDCHRYLECFFALPMLGAVLHTVNIRLSPEQILYTINHAEDDFILLHEDFLPIYEEIAARIEKPPKLVLLSDTGNADSLPTGFVAEYESALASVSTEFEFADFDERTPATTFYTTGTTGDPKGVCYNQRQLVLHTMGLLAGFGPVAGPCRFHEDDVYMPITPMFHVHGWGFPFAATLLGVKQVYPGRYDPATLLTLIEREGVTFSHCVPTILHMLLSAPESKSTDLSGWKVIIGGSALSEGLANAALDRGIEVFSAYGMSETCPVLTVSDVRIPASTVADNPAARAETLKERCKTGRPVPMVDLKLFDPEANVVEQDGVATGEVVARAPWLSQGYVKDAEGSETLWRHGYLHTGDVGNIDGHGSLQVTDRIKDVIKSGGEWISSLDLENITSTCAGVAECAAIGVADEKWGERPMILVVMAALSETDDAQPHATRELEQKLEQGIRLALQGEIDSGRFSKWAMPEKIVFVESLEKTSVGKLDKKKLRLQYTS